MTGAGQVVPMAKCAASGVMVGIGHAKNCRGLDGYRHSHYFFVYKKFHFQARLDTRQTIRRSWSALRIESVGEIAAFTLFVGKPKDEEIDLQPKNRAHK